MAQVPEGFHRVNFNCPEETHALLMKHCKEVQRTMASVLNEWILTHLERHIPENDLRLSPDFVRGRQFIIEAEPEDEGHGLLAEVADDPVSSRLL